jgi:serine/threonine protein kinase
MDFAIGGEMFHHLKKVSHFPENLGVFYLAEVVLAFEYLHEFDIVFRDTKPENLLLDAYGHVMLTDFGLAKTGVSADSS